MYVWSCDVGAFFFGFVYIRPRMGQLIFLEAKIDTGRISDLRIGRSG